MTVPIVKVTDNNDGTLTLVGAVSDGNGSITITVPDRGRYFTFGTGTQAWDNVGPDAYGNQWKMLGDPGGWDGPPDATGDFAQRPNSDGAFDDDVYDEGRTLTFSGQCVSPDLAGMAQARKQIQAVAKMLKDATVITGHWGDGDYTVTGKRAPGWQVARISPLIMRYQFVVFCTDPYKYGPEVSASTGLPVPGGGMAFPLFDGSGLLMFGKTGVSGQITLTNTGTADAWPLFTAVGPIIGGIVLTDVGSGRRIVYAGDVPSSGVLLIIDSASGRATLNGAPRDTELTITEWFSVPAGGSSTVQFATLGEDGQSGQLTGSIQPPSE